MPLIVPSYPNARKPEAPIEGAYARISHFEFDRTSGAGSLRMGVWFSQAAHDKGLDRLEEISIVFGDDFGNDQHFPTLAEAMADPTFAQIYAGLKTWLETKATLHPALTDASQV